MRVRVALAQFSGHIDKNVNIEKAENLARQAAGARPLHRCYAPWRSGWAPIIAGAPSPMAGVCAPVMPTRTRARG